MKIRNLLMVTIATILIPVGTNLVLAQNQLPNPQNNSQNNRPNQPQNSPQNNSQNPFCPPPMGQGRQGQGQAGSGGQNNGLPPWSSQINLTSDQQNRIQTLHQQNQQSMQQFHTQMQQLDQEMQSLLNNNNSTSDQLRQKNNQIQQLRQQMESRHFDMMLAEREILTPQQRQQLQTLMEQCRPQR